MRFHYITQEISNMTEIFQWLFKGLCPLNEECLLISQVIAGESKKTFSAM